MSPSLVDPNSNSKPNLKPGSTPDHDPKPTRRFNPEGWGFKKLKSKISGLKIKIKNFIVRLKN